MLCALVAMFVAEFSYGQCIFRQPWDKRSASHSSIVRSCDQPSPMDVVAMDDFVCRDGAKMNRLRWWGVLLDKKQYKSGRSYYIAIYDDNGNCQPGDKLYETCVKPQEKYVGKDCAGNHVVMFTTKIPPFGAAPGQRYWLQISEDDSNSARPGIEDFRWSGRMPIQFCPALQMDVAGGIRQPLIDRCTQKEVDLSFIIAAL